MKQLFIVSTGAGRDTLTREADRAVADAEALLGAPRMLEAFAPLQKPMFPVYAPEPVAALLACEPYERFALLVSGDAGFFSAADAVCRALEGCRVTVLPGVSALQALFARLNRPWQDAALLSCHGRSANLADAVRRSRTTFALTGGNLETLAGQLIRAGFGGLSAAVGENLGLENERIVQLPVSALPTQTFGPLTVLLVDNPSFDPRVRSGLPDEAFLRGNVPMTKAEVRAVTLSKLALSPDAVCYDIGAGTGSVTVEMALAAYRGRVYAIDRSEEAIRLITQNRDAFHIGNITPVPGDAPAALDALPPPDAAFIGGSGGNLAAIVACILKKNPHARIVVNAIALESAAAALSALSAHALSPEMIQLCVSKARPAGELHLLMAGNPVFIISGGGHA